MGDIMERFNTQYNKTVMLGGPPSGPRIGMGGAPDDLASYREAEANLTRYFKAVNAVLKEIDLLPNPADLKTAEEATLNVDRSSALWLQIRDAQEKLNAGGVTYDAASLANNNLSQALYHIQTHAESVMRSFQRVEEQLSAAEAAAAEEERNRLARAAAYRKWEEGLPAAREAAREGRVTPGYEMFFQGMTPGAF